MFRGSYDRLLLGCSISTSNYSSKCKLLDLDLFVSSRWALCRRNQLCVFVFFLRPDRIPNTLQEQCLAGRQSGILCSLWNYLIKLCHSCWHNGLHSLVSFVYSAVKIGVQSVLNCFKGITMKMVSLYFTWDKIIIFSQYPTWILP